MNFFKNLLVTRKTNLKIKQQLQDELKAVELYKQQLDEKK